MKRQDVTLFYDGLCPLCSREVAHYRKHAPAEGLAFVDIADPTFDAASHGLDPLAIHHVMHVKVGDNILTGVDAFLAVWELLPPYRWIVRLARVSVVRWFMKLSYFAYARVRPWLPRRKQACASETCRV